MVAGSAEETDCARYAAKDKVRWMGCSKNMLTVCPTAGHQRTVAKSVLPDSVHRTHPQ